ncbi:TniB family NTP-binding protein [Streptomyces malaysiensis]|uniref:TniB family NTP-binding protein n=1 Tax=Streptomyces malaysiensis TaxID=92644 RepID=UPI0031BA81ED
MTAITRPALEETEIPSQRPDTAGGLDEHRQLTTLQGWRRFIGDARTPPGLLPERTWAALTDQERIEYDEARLDHHSRLLVVATSTVRRVIAEGRRLTYLNRGADVGRCGMLLSGPARTGKTTALIQLGKTIELIHRQRHPRSPADIPVVYITTPPAATPRMVAAEFARFLGLPITRRSNITDVMESVCGVLIDARATLIAVDELHNIQLSSRSGGEVSDTLKYFSERIPATFVYAGIDIEQAGLLSGTRGEQIAGRFSMVPTGSFPLGEEWRGLIAALEGALRLHHHSPDALTGLEHYLHQRTAGMIGSLLRLVRSAAIQAVLDGSEEITKRTLQDIDVDIASERTRPLSP